MGYHFGNEEIKEGEAPKFPTTKDFKSTAKAKPVSPEVHLENVKKTAEVKAWEASTLETKLKDKKKLVESSKLYTALLKLYLQLSSSEKEAIKTWIADNQKVIKKYRDYKKLKKETEDAAQVNKLQNIELKYNLSLLKLKKEGIDPFNSVVKVATYRPTEKEIQLYKESNKPLPIFKGASPALKPIKLNKQGIAISSGLGASYEEVNETIKPFISTLPGQKQEDENEQERLAPALLRNKTQEIVERLPKLDMDIGALEKELSDLEKEVQKFQKKLNELLPNIDSDTATALGILVEIKPGRFTTSESIIAGLNSVINNINTLSGLGQSETPLNQAKELLSTQVSESKEVVKKLDITSKLLTNAQNALVGKPVEPISQPVKPDNKLLLVGLSGLALVGLVVFLRRRK